MYDFNYVKPASLSEAAAARAAAEDGLYMAGGQTMIPVMKQRLSMPTDVIDLGAIAEIKGITAGAGTVRVGAMTTHAEVATSAEVKSAIPALAHCAGVIGDPHVRNRGTMGGALAHSDPSADYPAAVLGLGATIHTDRRQIAADDYFLGLFETALEDGELITAIEFPVPRKAAYVKFSNPASGYAIVGVMVAVFDAGVRLAVTGAGPCAFRVNDMERALEAEFRPDALAGISVSSEGLNSDLHASAEYRAHLVGVIARRAVAAAG